MKIKILHLKFIYLIRKYNTTNCIGLQQPLEVVIAFSTTITQNLK